MSRDGGVLRQEIVLDRGFAIRGRLLAGEGVPAAGTSVSMHAMVSTGDDTWSGTPAPKVVLATDAAGRFEVPCCEPGLSYSLWAHLDARSYARLAHGKKGRLLRRVCLAAEADAGGGGDLGDVRLDKLEALEIQVLEADGSASAGALLLLETRASRGTLPMEPTSLVLDARGRGLLLAAPGTIVRLAAGSDAGYVAREVREDAAGQPVRLQLPTNVPIAGKVVDEKGRPMAGVRLSLAPAGAREGLFLSWYMDPLRHDPVVATDASGAFGFEVVPGGTYSIGATEESGRSQAVVADVSRGGVANLELVLDSKEAWQRAAVPGRGR
jgi:hypothetical protein